MFSAPGRTETGHRINQRHVDALETTLAFEFADGELRVAHAGNFADEGWRDYLRNGAWRQAQELAWQEVKPPLMAFALPARTTTLRIPA
jgi:hypothetical protein